ncbi:MAG: hypothetical protein O2966_04110 [Proteobacteria bacterium]|nr:hypothetical protein [Pseudomonadota bacterium]
MSVLNRKGIKVISKHYQKFSSTQNASSIGKIDRLDWCYHLV